MANPNKTVAKARARMGGFGPRSPQPVSDFMAWVFEQAAAGNRFSSEEAAREAFDSRDKDQCN